MLVIALVISYAPAGMFSDRLGHCMAFISGTRHCRRHRQFVAYRGSVARVLITITVRSVHVCVCFCTLWHCMASMPAPGIGTTYRQLVVYRACVTYLLLIALVISQAHEGICSDTSTGIRHRHQASATGCMTSVAYLSLMVPVIS